MVNRLRIWLLGAAVVALVVPACSPPPPRFGEVARVGRGEPTLVLVPCLGCDYRAWDELMERNADRYTLFAVTWPGMGATALPEVAGDPDELPLWSYLLEAMTTLLEEEDLDDVILLGHSAASPYVVQYAHAHPQRIRGVVTVDGTITNWDTYGYSRSQRLEWAAAEYQEVLDRYDDDEAWAALNAPPKLPSPERSALYGEMWMRPPRRHVLAYWREWLAADSGALIADFPRPLLSVFAIRPSDEDPERTRRERLARFERAGAPRHVRVEFIENAGHSIWEWRPQELDRLIADFAESTSAPAGD